MQELPLQGVSVGPAPETAIRSLHASIPHRSLRNAGCCNPPDVRAAQQWIQPSTVSNEEINPNRTGAANFLAQAAGAPLRVM